MANMTFKANLMPDNAAQQRELGSSSAKWKINGYFPVVSITTTGTGNAVTAISNTDGAVTVTKGTSFSTTDKNVQQSNSTANSALRILLSSSADDNTTTATAYKSTNLQFNPSTKMLSIGGSITATGDITITGNANLNGETYADSLSAGSLLVTGAASFTNSPTAPTPATSSNDTTVATTAFVKSNAYSHPTTTSATAAAVKVGKDTLGHVVIGSALTKSDVGLGNVDNKSSATIRSELTSANVTAALGFTPYNSTNPSGYTTNTGTVTKVTAGSGLTTTSGGSTDGGDITTTGTLYLTKTGTSTGSFGMSANTTGSHGTTINIPYITVDVYGRITAISNKVYTAQNNTYSLSGLGGVGSVSASGTAPLTLGATKSGTAVSITGTVAAATTSTAGVMAMSQANLNTMINQLGTGSSTPVDADYYISQYVSGGATTTTYHRRPMSALYAYIKDKLSITNNNVNLSRNTETTIATIGGTAIKIKLPASDNTDTKQNIILASTSKAYVTGVTTAPTSTTAAMTGVGDTGVYLTTTAGELSAVRHSYNVSGTEKAYSFFNTATNAIDFVFA